MAAYSLQEADAEEAVADTFIAFWRESDKIKYTFGDCRNWLIGVLKNKIRDRINYYKAAKRTFIKTHGWIDEDESLNHSVDPTIPETDYMQELKNALIILSKKERRVMNLSMVGMDTRQIAAQLNVSPQTVMNQRTTAVKKLRVHFNIRTGANVRYYQ
jgi:RNA polymerase sigma factor (sigma-70 family)